MIYLILATLTSSMVSIIMRFSERRCRNNIALLAVNYFVCSITGALYTGSAQLFPAQAGLGLTLFMGVIGGILFLSSFMMLQWNIGKNGVLLPTTFMKLGVIIPVLMSIVVFGEEPRLIQIIGILLAVFAILIMNGRGTDAARSTLGLVVLLVSTGMCNAMSKIFEQVGPSAFSNHFLFYIFTTAFLLCTVICLLKGQRFTRNELLWGLAIGIPNYFSSRFMLLSLSYIPASIAYPSYSVGSIVLVALAGVILFKEKIARRRLIALGIIMAALAMLNM